MLMDGVGATSDGLEIKSIDFSYANSLGVVVMMQFRVLLKIYLIEVYF